MIKRIICIFLFFIGGQVSAKPLLEIQHWKTKEGVRIYFVQTKQLPILDVRFLFEAGSVYDGDKPGLASLTNSLLNQGTAQLTADQIAEGFDSIGARFFVFVDRDRSVLGLRSLTKKKNLAEAIELLHEVVVRPIFPDKAIERLRHQALTAIQQEQELPEVVASNVFYRELYGNHPYARPVIGEEQSVREIARKDILNFYQSYYVANRAVLVMVGDVSCQEAHVIADEITAGLPKKDLPSLHQASFPIEKASKKIVFPSTQSYIYHGCLGMDYKDENYFPLFVGNHIFGGDSFVSRLFQQVREKEGLSYCVSSDFFRLFYKGPFFILLQTKNKSASKALALSKKALLKFIRKGPTEKELSDAKQYLTGSFDLLLDSNAKIAEWLMSMGFYQLPLNYLDTYRDKINSVTSENIKAAFQSVLSRQKWITVVVGK